METYIIRIYRYKKNNPRRLVGTAEKVGSKGKRAFTNLDELWEILNSNPTHPPLTKGRRRRGKESGSQREKGYKP